MGESTIEWTRRRLPSGKLLPGFTFNIVWGCQRISEGCKHCYADTLASRYGFSLWGPPATTSRRTFGPAYWQGPLRWNRLALHLGHRLSVFCSSMADTFEDHPVVAGERAKLWALISETPFLNWLLLTKRPENILAMVPWRGPFPDNVWVGTSIELQKRTAQRLPYLVEVPAVVRFVSAEPLLEPLDLSSWLPRLQWVICGGESDKDARPFDLDWARLLRDQCRAASVPFFFKQVGGRYHTSGGRLLDGRTYDDMPPEVNRYAHRL